ncbi:MAG: UDP-N-acetylglucosamine 2-epimerase (hydrolyzing) [Magnetococcales bacterium]|nr:UDP-N-acetylglucosamine 2-epimerase (hydrolyzing) [Magnetococcales bacterium]
MRRFIAVSGSRADYDLMSHLYRRLHHDPTIELKLLVCGSHLSPTFGRTIEQIRQDGFDILLAMESLLDSDSSAARVKSAAIFLQGAVDVVASYQPDAILYPGDREEAIIAALLGAYLEIPTVHFFGGDHTCDGHVDNPVRHATSKLSTWHLVALEQHRQRLLQMGELPERIFNVGSVALDKFIEQRPLPLTAIRDYFRLSPHPPTPSPTRGEGEHEVAGAQGVKSIGEQFALVIFHPVAAEKEQAGRYFENILLELRQRQIQAFVGAPNSDAMNRAIFAVAQRYEQEPHFIFYRSLPRELFLSIYKQSRFIIGNSSSGILEAASIPIPAINVGLRQQGRAAAANVIFCGSSRDEIGAAIDQATSTPFLETIRTLVNPYGDGHSSVRAHRLLQQLDFRSLIDKREDPLSPSPPGPLSYKGRGGA